MNPNVLIILNVIVVILMVCALIYNKRQRDRVFKDCNDALIEASDLHRRAMDALFKYNRRAYGREFSIPDDYKSNPDAYIQMQKEALLNTIRRRVKEGIVVKESSPGKFLLLVNLNKLNYVKIKEYRKN